MNDTEHKLRLRLDKELTALRTTLNLIGLSDICNTDLEFFNWCYELERKLKEKL